MKYLWTIMVLLILCVPLLAEDFEVTEAEYVPISGNVSDTLGRTRITPDSIRIVVTDSAGTELHDAWYEPADAQCILNGDIITFTDQWEDINGAASVGVFSIVATIASDGQGDVDVFSQDKYTLRGLALGVVQRGDSLQAALDSAQAIMAKLILVQDTVNGMMDSLQLQDGWVAQEGSLFDPTSDSVIADGSSLAATAGAITNTTMASNSIGADEIAANAIEDGDIASIQVNVESMSAGTITSTQLGTACIGSDELGATAVDEIWDEDSTGHNTAGSFGQIIEDLLDSINVLETWIAQEASLFDPTSDSVIVDGSSLAATGGAIAAATIADDAIDYGTFAATAPTAWWNEGKTGYALTDAQWELVWYAIDTTNIDTSLLGEWFATGITASIADAEWEKVWFNIDTSNVDTSDIGDWLRWAIESEIWGDTNTTLGEREELLKVAGDSSGWANLADVWRNQDSGNVDTSDIGDWLIANVGGGSLTNITDTVNAILDSLQLLDGWAAQEGSLETKEAIADAVLDTMEAGTRQIQYRSLTVDSGTVFGAQTTGNAIDIIATTGHGINIATTTGDGIRSRSSSGDGMDLGGGGAGFGLDASGPGGDYNGRIIIEDTLEGGELVAFMPDDWSAADTTAYQGSGGFDSTAVYGAVEQLMIDSQGVFIPADTLMGGEQIAFMPDDFTAADSVGYQGSGLVTPTDTTESGYAVSSQGFGPDTLVLYFNDTSGTDTPIGDVFFSIQNSAGTNVMAFASETATGKRTVHLTDGSYTVVPRKTGYIFDSYALTASGNDDSVEVAGYDRVVGTSGVSSVCRMYGYVTDVGADWFKNVSITASLPSDTYDSCANTIVFERTKGTRSNDTGYFYIDLIYSSCLSDEKYKFTFEKKNHETITKDITVPDSTTCYIRWDD